MQKVKYLIAAVFIVVLVACAGVGGVGLQSPESQILTGANAVTATTTVATVALRNQKITVEQAKGFRALLGAASSALDSANVELIACRKETATVAGVVNDPCRPKVTDLIVLALDSVAGVKRSLDAK